MATSTKGMRARPRIGVALVVANDLLGEERDISDAPCEQTDMVKGAREREHSVP